MTERVPWWLVGLVVLAGVGAVVAFVLGRRQRAREVEAGAAGGSGGFRERQARARGGSSAKLDEIMARGERVPGRDRGPSRRRR